MWALLPPLLCKLHNCSSFASFNSQKDIVFSENRGCTVTTQRALNLPCFVDCCLPKQQKERLGQRHRGFEDGLLYWGRYEQWVILPLWCKSRWSTVNENWSAHYLEMQTTPKNFMSCPMPELHLSAQQTAKEHKPSGTWSTHAGCLVPGCKLIIYLSKRLDSAVHVPVYTVIT